MILLPKHHERVESKMNQMDKEIAGILSQMTKSFDNSVWKEHGEEMKAALAELEGEQLPSFSNFSRATEGLPNDAVRIVSKALVKRINPEINEVDLSKVSSVYAGYRKFNTSLVGKIKKMEGWVCSQDKSGAILWIYVMVAMGKDLHSIVSKLQDFQLPVYGSLGLWLDLVDSLRYFFAGQDEKYLDVSNGIARFYRNRK